MLRVLCVLLGLYVLYALCALYAFSKPYVQHRGPQKRASGQKRTDGSQRNIYPKVSDIHSVSRAGTSSLRSSVIMLSYHRLAHSSIYGSNSHYSITIVEPILSDSINSDEFRVQLIVFVLLLEVLVF